MRSTLETEPEGPDWVVPQAIPVRNPGPNEAFLEREPEPTQTPRSTCSGRSSRLGKIPRLHVRQLSMLVQFGVRKGWIREDPRLTYRLPREEVPDPNPFPTRRSALSSRATQRRGPGARRSGAA
jgi:hypothetical protein